LPGDRARSSSKLFANIRAESENKGESLGNLAAGIVGKSGEVVDDTGNTVGKITEGTPADLGTFS
jgi:uncharacterized protein DUF3659